MIDLTGPKGQLVAAALDLAKDLAWRDITLLDIANAAGMTLSELREQFKTKADLLSHFTKLVDAAVINRPPVKDETESSRERVFEVIMNRFDTMAPYKAALKSITSKGIPDPMQVRAVMASQHWMLQAAGVSTDGLGGVVRIAGLTSIYASVFRTWLQDDDAGQAKTMAALDRRLRRGDEALARLGDGCSSLCSLACRVRSIFRASAGGGGGATAATQTSGDDLKEAGSSASPPPADPGAGLGGQPAPGGV